jgi:uncharacterized membrane protein
MTTFEKSVDVKAPLRVAYRQWTRFESYPMFMAGVDRVEQTTPTRTHWRTSIGGVAREFDAEITERYPDERVSWRSVSGPDHTGRVTFHRIDDETTRVHLRMEFESATLAQRAGTALTALDHRIRGDLRRFKDLIERRASVRTNL